MAYIRVRNKRTGKTGLLPEESFNKGKYEVIGPNQDTTPATSAPQQQPNFLQSLFKPFSNTFERIGGGAETLMKEYLINQSEKARQMGDFDRAQKLSQTAAMPTRLTEDEAYRNKLSSPLQMAKDTAGVLSWGVPVGGATKVGSFLKGGGATLRTGVGTGGLIAGGAGGFGYSEKEDLGGLLQDTAVGAGTGYASAKILNKLLGGKAAKATEGKQGYISKKASENFLNLSPDDFRNAKEMGVDLREALPKYVSGVNNYDDALKMVGSELGKHEARIQSVLADKGDELISREGGIEALKGLREELSLSPTNNTAIKRLDVLIKSFEKTPKVAASKAMQEVRSANKIFEEAVIATEKGAVDSRVKKIMANHLRGALKTRFKDVSGSLKAEQELMLLEGAIKKASSKQAVSGTSGLSRVDITRPGTIANEVLKNPAVSSRAAQVGQRTGEAVPETVINQKLKDFIGQRAPGLAGATTPLVFGSQSNVPTEEDTLDISTGNKKTALRSQFEEAMKKDLVQNSGKNIDKLQKVYDFLEGKSSSGETAQRVDTAKSGLRSAKDIRTMLKSDPSLLTKQLIPGKFASRSFDAALYNMADAVLRLRTGAQANEEEIRGYMKRLVTAWGDSPADINYKLKSLESQFGDIIGE